jgi:hypothetical protein
VIVFCVVVLLNRENVVITEVPYQVKYAMFWITIAWGPLQPRGKWQRFGKGATDGRTTCWIHRSRT